MAGFENRRFPEGFKFGSSTSAFQVEANTDGTRRTDWDSYLKTLPNVKRPQDVGLDWWEKGQAEVDLERISSLGLNASRIGIEWARIQPDRHTISREAIRRYRSIVDKLHAQGMEPMITLNHFSLPSWVAEEGGWEKTNVRDAFKNYAAVIGDSFGDVPYWITVNEPNILLSAGYLNGIWPPHKNPLKNPGGFILSSNNVIRANALAFNEIKRRVPESKIGATHAVVWFDPEKSDTKDRVLAKVANRIFNTPYAKFMNKSADFTAVDFYTGYNITFQPKLNVKMSEDSLIPIEMPLSRFSQSPGSYKSEMGWPVVPAFFLEALQYMHKEFKKPVIVTENGVADREDKLRSFYLLTHLTALHEAIQRGVDVRGYYHWSTVSNLEWNSGFKFDFGLLGLNQATGERTMRQSADLYGEIARAGEIDINSLSERYLTLEQQQRAKRFFEKLEQGR